MFTSADNNTIWCDREELMVMAEKQYGKYGDLYLNLIDMCDDDIAEEVSNANGVDTKQWWVTKIMCDNDGTIDRIEVFGIHMYPDGLLTYISQDVTDTERCLDFAHLMMTSSGDYTTADKVHPVVTLLGYGPEHFSRDNVHFVPHCPDSEVA